MPWLGFSFAKRKPPASAHTKSPPEPIQEVEEEDDIGTDEKPTIRLLKPEEIEQLQNENEQLKKLIQQLAEKAKQQEGSSTPSMYPNLSSSSSTTSSSAEYAFQQVPDLNSLMSQHGLSAMPSAPTLDSNSTSPTTRRNSHTANISPAELAPVSDFYESLRRSLGASTTKSTTSSSSTMTLEKPKPKSKELESDEEDEWGESTSNKQPPPVDSVHAPRTEDEAIVHNKHGSVVVHKKPLRPLKDDDDDVTGSGPTLETKSSAANRDFDEFGEDEFGMETESTSTSAPMASSTSTDEPEEEIAIFDVSQADWWYVVPHPDRVNEELVSAPQPSLDPAEDEDGFVLIKSKDSFTALGEFISSMMAKHPQIAKLSPEQLREMLEQSMLDRGIKEPTTMGKMWQMGKQIYTVWSYGSWGLSLYRDQTAMRMIAAGVIKAATWTCVFLM